jgi:BON domain
LKLTTATNRIGTNVSTEMLAPRQSVIGWSEARSSSVIAKQFLEITMSSTMFRAFGAALTLSAVLSGCVVFPKSSSPTVDQKITADVETRFGQHAELEAPDLLEVQTINQVVYLNGTVSTGLQREYAESVANQAQGVARVINSISVTH